MKKIKKIIGWFLVYLCISELFMTIVTIVTISTSVGDNVDLAKRQLPTFLFLTVVCGWVAYSLLSKKKPAETSMENGNAPAEKVKTGYKVLIYICEMFIALIGTFLICTIVLLITESNTIMQWAIWISLIGIMYFLPSPQQVFNYWRKRKHK